MPERKAILLRLDPVVHRALQRWAEDELRSLNGQIEFLLREACRRAGRLPGQQGPARPGSSVEPPSDQPSSDEPPSDAAPGTDSAGEKPTGDGP
ncbi:MAG: hypothetical protein ACK4PI_11140 [Tepidisphaerales bacterium]